MFANPFSKHTTDLSFPRRATTISSRTRKHENPREEGCENGGDVLRERETERYDDDDDDDDVPNAPREDIILEGEFTQILKEKETLGAHFFFLSFFFRSRARRKTRGLPDVLLSILSFFLSLFLSLSHFSCCVRACFLSVLTPRLASLALYLLSDDVRGIALAAWVEKARRGHCGSVRVAATAAVGRTLRRIGIG